MICIYTIVKRHPKELRLPKHIDTIIGHFSVIWYASLNNKTSQLFDWSVILVFLWQDLTETSACWRHLVSNC